MSMTVNRIIANNGSSIVLYTTDDGNTQLEVKAQVTGEQENWKSAERQVIDYLVDKHFDYDVI